MERGGDVTQVTKKGAIRRRCNKLFFKKMFKNELLIKYMGFIYGIYENVYKMHIKRILSIYRFLIGMKKMEAKLKTMMILFEDKAALIAEVLLLKLDLQQCQHQHYVVFKNVFAY